MDILKTMEPYERSKLADVLKEKDYTKGQVVIHEGEEGNELFFIVEGEAYASKQLEPGKSSTKVKNYHKGDYFGEMALIKSEPRAANVIAKTSLKVCFLDRHSFKRLLGSVETLLKRNMDLYLKIAAGEDVEEEL